MAYFLDVPGTVKRLNNVFPNFMGHCAIKSSLHGNFQRKGFSIVASVNAGLDGGVAELSEKEQDLKHYMWPDKKVSIDMICSFVLNSQIYVFLI